MRGKSRRSNAVAAIILALCLGRPMIVNAADDDLIPGSLPQAKREALSTFLAKVKEDKPTQFIPPGAKLQSVTNTAVEIDVTPNKNAEVKEYLAEIVPQRAADRQKGPERAEVYWFRPNPKRGAPGITVKRVVDLTSGEQVGDTIVLLTRPTALTREVQAQAIALARNKSEKVKSLYDDAKDEDISVAALFDQVTVKGVPDGNVGDRVVNLQFRRKGAQEVVSVNVNVTQETVREQK